MIKFIKTIFFKLIGLIYTETDLKEIVEKQVDIWNERQLYKDLKDYRKGYDFSYSMIKKSSPSFAREYILGKLCGMGYWKDYENDVFFCEKPTAECQGLLDGIGATVEDFKNYLQSGKF